MGVLDKLKSAEQRLVEAENRAAELAKINIDSNKEIKRLESSISDVTKKSDEANEKLAALDVEIKAKEDNIKELKSQTSTAKKKLKEVCCKIEDNQCSHKKFLEEKNAEISKLQGQIKMLTSELSDVQSNFDETTRGLRATVNHLNSLIETKRETVGTLQDKEASIKSNIEELRIKESAIKSSVDSLKQEELLVIGNIEDAKIELNSQQSDWKFKYDKEKEDINSHKKNLDLREKEVLANEESVKSGFAKIDEELAKLELTKQGLEDKENELKLERLEVNELRRKYTINEKINRLST